MMYVCSYSRFARESAVTAATTAQATFCSRCGWTQGALLPVTAAN